MRESSGSYKFYNANPRGLVRAADCVFRALSLALDMTWDQALLDLTKLSLELKDAPNSYRIFENYLKNRGFEKQGQPKKSNGKKYRLFEFAEKFKRGTYLVRMTRHTTVVKDGYIYDTWDCRGQVCGNYWIIKED